MQRSSYSSFSALSLVIFAFCASPSFAASTAEQYASCTEKVRTDPNAALAHAQAWLKQGENASASHCQALALYALKDYANAAQILERISDPLKHSNLNLWQDITEQTARSWRYAEQMHRAIATLNRAILFASEDAYVDSKKAGASVKLLNARAQYYVLSKRPLDALQDYDHALNIDAASHQTRLARATLLAKMKETRLANDDAKRVMNAVPDSDPLHQAAKKLIR